MRETNKNIAQDTKKKKVEADLSEYQIRNIANQTETVKLHNRIINLAGIPAAEKDKNIWEGDYGQIIRYLQKFNPFGKFNVGGIGK